MTQKATNTGKNNSYQAHLLLFQVFEVRCHFSRFSSVCFPKNQFYVKLFVKNEHITENYGFFCLVVIHSNHFCLHD